MIRNEAVEQYERRKATELAERQHTLREKRLEYAEKIADQILQMVTWPLARKETEQDGKTVVFKPARWSKTTIAHLDAVVASMIEAAGAQGTTPEFEKLMEIFADEEEPEPHD